MISARTTHIYYAIEMSVIFLFLSDLDNIGTRVQRLKALK